MIMPRIAEQIEWLSLIDISGPFLAGKVLEETFPQGLDKIETPQRQRLRAAYDEWRDAVDENDSELNELHDVWTRMVLREALEYEEQVLIAKNDQDRQLVYQVPEHDLEEEPDFAVRTDDGAYRLLVTIYPPKTDLEKPVVGDRWIASPAERMTALCRGCDVRLGLITNGEQWMLVNAPIGNTSGYASWFARIWAQEPVTLKAFASLLGVRRCFGPEERRLDQLLEKSLAFQDEVTDTLGEQVRRAVEVLVQSLGRADQDRNGELLKEVRPEELYEAGLTVMMRLVFILCAEERDLLLLGDPIYDQHYAISTLRARLREDADQYGVEVLERRHDAWSRILSVFRMVYGGVDHEALRMPALGGSLFDPDRFPFLEGRSVGSSWQEEPASPLPIDNRTVLLLMNALQVIERKGGAQLLSYRALDVEQIGHVYEGLLEYTAARLPEPTVALIGSKKVRRPMIAIGELESIAAEATDTAAEALAKLTGRSKSAMKKALEKEGDQSDLVELIQACGGDEELAKRLLPFATLIQTDSWGTLLVYREGAFAIVLGTDRRETGTHYTPRSLTEPIVQYTLEPIVYIGPAEGTPRKDWALKPPAELLDLKICDMACGSGAFLVEVCRYLSQKLVKSWIQAEEAGSVVTVDGEVFDQIDGRDPLPKSVDDRLTAARRLIVQRCIYGVDVNPLAVELAKLSIWLVTLAKNKPFSFLDHALRCGDSLVGLHDLEQLRHYSLKPDADDAVLFKGPLDSAVDTAINLRLSLECMTSNTVQDVEAQEILLAKAEDKMARLRCSADLLVAAEFWGENARDKEEKVRQAAVASGYYVEKGPTEEFQEKAAKERQGQKMFHWPLEFPEVMVKRSGFDAFVGNPPFIGGTKISSILGVAYLSYIQFTWGKGNRADLCSYFLLRGARLIRPNSSIGLITTNTISQGSTREVGLELLLSESHFIIRAVPSCKWPGTAALEVALVWLYNGDWTGDCILNEHLVTKISDYLEEAFDLDGSPERLEHNAGKSFTGSYVMGMGFILTSQEVNELLAIDSRNQDVLFPYINGDALNTSSDQTSDRWAINFKEWPLDHTSASHSYIGPCASDYPNCLAIVEDKVKPERLSKKSKGVASAPWWQYWRVRSELYGQLENKDQVLVCSEVTKYLAFIFIPTRAVLTSNLDVFPHATFSTFMALQSTLHDTWARFYCAHLENRLKYSPGNGFETFPFCELEESHSCIGNAYHSHRCHLMLTRQEGLTVTYNRFHDSDENSKDTLTLRNLHVELDQAVAAAYGWDDLNLGHGFLETKQGLRYTISEVARREVLQRLLKLNHERYAEEVEQGLHDKKKKRAKKKTKPVDSKQEALPFDLDGGTT